MTARYSPASTSSLRKRMSCFEYRGAPKTTFLLSEPRCPEPEEEVLEPVGRDEGPVRLQRAPATQERLLADGVQDDVVRLAVLGEVLPQVVDHLAGSQRAHEVHVLGVADRGDVGAEVLRELHRGGPTRSGGAVHQEARALPDAAAPQRYQPLQEAVAEGGGLPEGHGRGNGREEALLPHAHELGMRPEAADAEDAIAAVEVVDCCAECLHLARELDAEDPPLRPEDAEEEPPQERPRSAHVAIRLRDGRRAEPDQHLVLLRDRPRDLAEP